MMKIAICGGGNLGHVVAGVLSSKDGVSVSLLTTRPEKWGDTINVSDPDGKIYSGKIEKISDKASDVIPGMDYVILCLPGFAIADTLSSIVPYLSPETVVGSIVSSTGFFFEALEKVPSCNPLFGFQRVPYISRITEYGKAASLLGYKVSLNIAVENADVQQKEEIRKTVEKLFLTPVSLLHNHYEASLTNSNPLLHPARLYTMWKDWDGTPYTEESYFYRDWTDEASDVLIKMDEEFHEMLTKLPVDKIEIPGLLDYYGCNSVHSLTEKIKSIEAFKNIKSPMRQEANGGFIPDFSSRYFTEDFPFGMRFIVECARKTNSAIPVIDQIYTWGSSKLTR